MYFYGIATAKRRREATVTGTTIPMNSGAPPGAPESYRGRRGSSHRK